MTAMARPHPAVTPEGAQTGVVTGSLPLAVAEEGVVREHASTDVGGYEHVDSARGQEASLRLFS